MRRDRLSRLAGRVLATGGAIAILAVIMSGTGIASASRHTIDALIDGHPLSATPKPGGILLLGRNRRFPSSAIPTVARATSARTARSARSAQSAHTASELDGRTLVQVTGSCPQATVDIGTWCLMTNPYPIAASQQGLNDYFFATRACVDIGGYLPSAAQLIGAAAKVKLESTIDDNPSTATVEAPGDGSDGPELDQREMSSDLVTTQAGSDAAGSEGVTPGAHPDPVTGQPDPTPEPAVPSPPTLQYVTVYSNHTQGGFAGSEPVGDPENFRCVFDLKQSMPVAGSGASARLQSDVLRRSLVDRRRSRRP